jgi:hypothetical protein
LYGRCYQNTLHIQQHYLIIDVIEGNVVFSQRDWKEHFYWQFVSNLCHLHHWYVLSLYNGGWYQYQLINIVKIVKVDNFPQKSTQRFNKKT